MQITNIIILNRNHHYILIFILFLVNGFLDLTVINAQSIDSIYVLENETSSINIEITGLVFDETITKIGKDFYDMFYTKWEFPDSGENFFITISEKPIPGMGTRINIVIDNNTVFQQFVHPNYEQMVQLTGYAVNILNNYILNYEAMKHQLDESDQLGSGIY